MRSNKNRIYGLAVPMIGAALVAGSVLAGAAPRVALADDDCPPGAQAQITSEQATNIALGQAAGTLHEIDLDCDDGRLIYEVEIRPADGGQRVEVDVDAVTGAVLKVDRD